MTIQTRPATPEYEENWERIFGKKERSDAEFYREANRILLEKAGYEQAMEDMGTEDE